MYKFAPASTHEPIVFGAAKPGHSHQQVHAWLAFMQSQGIQRVCCLLPPEQLAPYPQLLDIYRQTSGGDRVCWAPIADFHLAPPDRLIHEILPFLAQADRQQEKVVVHCAGGIGRTGHILAAWLVAGRGLTPKAAIAAVRQTGRNPYEAIIAAPFYGRNPWTVATTLHTLLAQCVHWNREAIGDNAIDAM